ncbi:hypothetical protein ASF99_16685 [Exiguobacterium sp. Leaf187]|uniref:Uncharacterized protein n=2 Tax=Exiguobacterium TaxID=33986 RepID=A0A0V8GFM9_9BACL|nr:MULTISPECIES: hypothetical protein [Exiguobacterium]AHA29034.1 hypothetical protein U719_03850 [Exiguobacterium sp. MH3]AOS99882.1 hypothetical protein ESP131_06270 [Exiguobacterium sp. U13-1]KNH37310.1 hypothetical protein ACS74_02210 [Exiguobacterium acetylicum]KQS20594.1 hypothetical protein ASF99_16685 [Exiguobacterium sp. Leaf187]KQS44614.1 hypothetical protein ASG02_00820 [Exiguobacterium sp. Leaf196]
MNESYEWLNRRKLQPGFGATGGRRFISSRIVRPENTPGKRIKGIKRARQLVVDDAGNRRWVTKRIVVTDAAKHVTMNRRTSIALKETNESRLEQVKQKLASNKKVLLPILAATGIAVAGGVLAYVLRRKKKQSDQ